MASKAPGPQRYKPLPGITRLPGFLWRRLPRAARALLILGVVALLVTVAALIPGIRATKDENAARERRESAAARAEVRRRLIAESRPVAGSAAPDPAQDSPSRRLKARKEVLATLEVDITRDARSRARSGKLDGPTKRTECEPFPRQAKPAGAETDLSKRSGRYSCVAVTSDIPRSDGGKPGVVGHPLPGAPELQHGALLVLQGQRASRRGQPRPLAGADPARLRGLRTKAAPQPSGNGWISMPWSRSRIPSS